VEDFAKTVDGTIIATNMSAASATVHTRFALRLPYLFFVTNVSLPISISFPLLMFN
jgi:hypothetical protein